MSGITIYISSILLLEVLFIGGVLIVIGQALKKTGRTKKPVFVISIMLLLWLSGITFLNFKIGVFTKELLLGIGIPVILGVLLLLWKPYKEVVKAIPQDHYMKLQALRIVFGVVILAESLISELPSWFRTVAGFGDIAAGTAGLAVFIVIARSGVKQWQVITANSVGILDFLTVLPLGIFVIVPEASVGLTILLIPMFAVPLFILQHIYSLTYLKSPQTG